MKIFTIIAQQMSQAHYFPNVKPQMTEPTWTTIVSVDQAIWSKKTRGRPKKVRDTKSDVEYVHKVFPPKERHTLELRL